MKKKKPVENFPGCSAYAVAYHLTFRRAALKRGRLGTWLGYLVWSRAFSQSYFFLIFGFIYETTFIITYKPRASILICSKASLLA